MAWARPLSPAPPDTFSRRLTRAFLDPGSAKHDWDSHDQNGERRREGPAPNDLVLDQPASEFHREPCERDVCEAHMEHKAFLQFAQEPCSWKQLPASILCSLLVRCQCLEEL